MLRHTYLKESVLLFLLKFVGAEQFQTASGFFLSKTAVVTLEESEDIINDNRFEVDFLLVIKVLRFQLNLDKQ